MNSVLRLTDEGFSYYPRKRTINLFDPALPGSLHLPSPPQVVDTPVRSEDSQWALAQSSAARKAAKSAEHPFVRDSRVATF